MGSLVAALASYLDARQSRGSWRLRIEDIDPERDRPEAAATILAQLTAHELHWDGPLAWQASSASRYRQHAQWLFERGLAYACDCPRRRLASLDYRYDGRCRARELAFAPEHALRLNADVAVRADVAFQDRVFGYLSPIQPVDDFIIWRRGDLPAYQLAVVVDDASMGVTDVVRGADLLRETHRQLALFNLLQAKPPRYAHVPLVVGDDGRKLSKQNGATALDSAHPSGNLTQALTHLGVLVPAGIAAAPPLELFAFAAQHFSLEGLASMARQPT